MIYITTTHEHLCVNESIRVFTFKTYKEMSDFVRAYGVSPTSVYNTGRKTTDKRYTKPFAPFFFEKISNKQAKTFELKPTAGITLGEEETFETTRFDAQRLNDNNMCGVIATAVATNTLYDKCYDLFKGLGRKHGKGVSTLQIRNVLDKLGFRASIVNNTALNTGTMSTIHRRLDSNKTYLVFVRGHVACVKGGVVHDWTAGRRHHVKYILEVSAS